MISNTIYEEIFHPDIEKNALIQNGYMSWSILFIYILFSKVVGPGIMKNKKPMNLQMTMILYNMALVACNIYLSAVLTAAFFTHWPYRCDMENSPFFRDPKEYFFACMCALLVKFAELFDTVFFVLRKKHNQVSFLHIFHHSVVFVMSWVCLKYRKIGFYIIIIGSINSSIHVLLYLYYGLAALGPSVRKYLWWKRYLTTLQIMQFFVIQAYMIYAFLTGCEKAGRFDGVCLICVIAITVLFLNFYNKAYKTKRIVK